MVTLVLSVNEVFPLMLGVATCSCSAATVVNEKDVSAFLLPAASCI